MRAIEWGYFLRPLLVVCFRREDRMGGIFVIKVVKWVYLHIIGRSHVFSHHHGKRSVSYSVKRKGERCFTRCSGG